MTLPPPLRTLLLLPLLASLLPAEPTPFVPDAPLVPIWAGPAPGSPGNPPPERWIEGATSDGFHRVTDVHVPSITVYLPPRELSVGTAVVIAPGGGHRYLVVDLEGEFVARKLNDLGIAAFVLRYRLAHAEGSTYRVETDALADIQQAIRVVRERAADWQIDPQRVGVMGFSAGGQLAGLAATRFDSPTRPDFAVLGYPAWLDQDTPVPTDAPPTFLYANDDDPLAPAAVGFYLALRQAGVSAELHVFRRGGHGVGFTGRAPGFAQMPTAEWPDLLARWLCDRGLVPTPALAK